VIGSLTALIGLELRQMTGGRKSLVLGLALAGTTGLAAVVRSFAEPPAEQFWGIVFVLMLTFLFLQTLTLLIPLLYATSLMRNEIEEGTLVYLVTRPVPKPLLLLAKWAAATAFSGALLMAGMLAFMAAFMAFGDGSLGDFAYGNRLLRFMLAGLLGTIGYASIFTLVGLISRRALIWGIAYGFMSEFVLTMIPAVVRKLTVMHYLRSIALGDLEFGDQDVSEFLGLLDLASPTTAVVTVLTASALCLGASALLISVRELKPEVDSSAL
jgi:ABC-2 type transport system permease protein